MNELDSLARTVLLRVSLDIGSSDHRKEADAVLDLIGRHFHLGPRDTHRGIADEPGRQRCRSPSGNLGRWP